MKFPQDLEVIITSAHLARPAKTDIIELAVAEAFGADGFEKRLNEDGWGGIWKWVKP